MSDLKVLGATCIAFLFLGVLSGVSVIDVEAQRAERPQLVVQDGHLSNVEALTFSPTGRILASAGGSGDPAIKLWEVNSGRLIRSLPKERYSIRLLAFSPNGDFLAAANSAGGSACQIWDIKSGRPAPGLDRLRALQGPETPVIESIAFSPTGRTFAFSAGPLYLWDLSKDALLQKLDAHVAAIAFSPNGKIIAGVGPDREIILWQAETGQVLHSLPANAAFGREKVISFSPDGKVIAVMTEDQTIDLWDVNSGNSVRNLSSPDYYPRGQGLQAVRFSLDGKKLFVLINPTSGNVYEHLDIWDLTIGKVIRQIPSRDGIQIHEDVIAFSPDEKIFAAAFNSDITLRATNTGNVVRVIAGHDNSTAPLVVNPLQKTILLGSRDGPISVWDTNQTMICKLADEQGELSGIKFSPDGKTFVLDHQNDTSSFWNQRDCGNVLRNSGIDSERLVFAPDDKSIAVVEQQTIRLYSVEKGELMRVLRGHRNRIVSVAFSPNGKLIASVSEDKTVKVWNWEQDQTLYTLEDPKFQTGAVAFSPDGGILATGDGNNPLFVRSGERKIKLWEATSGKLLRSFGDHEWAITALAFSADGKLLASSSKDNTVKIWNVSGGQLIQRLETPDAGIWFAVFSPDGKTLITRGDTASDDPKVSFWDVSSGRLLNQATGDPKLKLIQFSPDGKSVAIATSARYEDTMTSLYSTNGELLASVIGFRGSWIVTTPDGLFDGSPETWNRINWRFAANEVAPVEAFFDEFYYPGLLTDILNGKRPKAATDIADKDRRQPEVAFLSSVGPQTAGGEVVASERDFTIRLEVNEIPADKARPTSSGAKDVRLFRNGSLVRIWHGNVLQKGGKATLETVVPLIAGENRFTAYAFNSDNVKSSDAELRVRGSDSLSRKGTAYILTVGINGYNNSQYNLKYAVADAEAFSLEVQRQLAHLDSFNQIQLISLRDQQATKANIVEALRRLGGASAEDSQAGSLAVLNKIKPAQPEDAVILYFAGHGTAQQKTFYLVPHDMGYTGERSKMTAADMQNVLDHSLSDRALDHVMEGINAGQFLLVIDACNSGQVLEADEKRPGPMNSKGLAQLAYEKGMYILTAAQSYQAALEVAQLGHGLLTYALIEQGLKETYADNDPHDGKLTVREWLNYASQRVPQIQIQKLKEARGLGLHLSFASEADSGSSLEDDHELQRPRTFYRRELLSNPFIIALFR